MSIQRWKVVDTLGQYAETGDDGAWVSYTDHVAVMQQWSEIAQDNFDAGRRAERLQYGDAFVRGVNAERARIKALIVSLERDGDYCKVLHSCDLLTAIDGESTSDEVQERP